MAFVSVMGVAPASRSSFVNTCRAAPQRRAGVFHGNRTTTNMSVGILFSTTTGNTEEAANMIKAALGDLAAEPVDILDASVADFSKWKEGIVVGAPTWNTDADTERSGTGMDEFIYGALKEVDMNGRPVAVFGLGDSVGYGDNFCDAIEEVHDKFAESGAKMVGYTSDGDYEYGDSKSVRDGKFIGLPLDADNEGDKTEERIQKWCDQLKSEMSL